MNSPYQVNKKQQVVSHDKRTRAENYQKTGQAHGPAPTICISVGAYCTCLALGGNALTTKGTKNQPAFTGNPTLYQQNA